MGDRSHIYESENEGERPRELGDIPPGISERTTTNEGTPLNEQKARIAMEREQGLRRTVLTFTIFSAGVTVALAISMMFSQPQLTPHGAVSSPNKICSSMGIDQMKTGGNAVDAAITTLLCLGAIAPQYTGLGGGGFMIIHDHKHHTSNLIDFRERAPSSLTSQAVNVAQGKDGWSTHGLSVGVPGELRGLYYAWQMYSKKSWGDLFAPVIHLVDKGVPWFPVNDLDLSRRESVRHLWSKNFQDVFQKINDGRGSSIPRPNLVKTLKLIANEGPDAFYTGHIAKNIVKAVESAGGVMSLDDLQNYNFTIREALNLTLSNGYVVETFPSPASGAILLAELTKMDHLAKEQQKNAQSLSLDEYIAKSAEILSSIHPCRSLIGDPDSDVDSINVFEQKLVSGDISSCGSWKTVEDHGTSHVSVVDQNEIIVSVTTSLNYWFGSTIMTDDGILLNNQMLDFDIDNPESRNAMAGGKVPASSMVPTVVYHKDRPCLKRFAIGGVNGTKIIGGVAQVISNLLLRDLSVREALDSPRIDCTDSPDCVLFDPDNRSKGSSGVEKMLGEAQSVVSVALKANDTPVAFTDAYQQWGGDSF